MSINQQTNSHCSVVCRPRLHHSCVGNSSIWLYFHRDVLRVYVFLVIQVLLCVWVHAVGLHHSGHGDYLHHNCGHLFCSQLRKLSLAVDLVHVRWFHSGLRVHVLDVLLLLQNSDDWFPSSSFLLWIYVSHPNLMHCCFVCISLMLSPHIISCYVVYRTPGFCFVFPSF